MALLAATSARDVARLRELLAGGARVWACEWRDPALEARDERGFTAFLMACALGKAECARLLARRGATEPRALRCARARGHHALADWLAAVDGFTPLHWACESRDPARVLAALQGDAVRDAGTRCGRVIMGTRCGGPTALELVTRPEAFPHTPSPVRKESAALVRAALAPWSPLTHRVQTAAFRRGVLAMLCVGARLRHDAVAPWRRLRSAPPPLLPPEVWLVVLSHCVRDWWVA